MGADRPRLAAIGLALALLVAGCALPKRIDAPPSGAAGAAGGSERVDSAVHAELVRSMLDQERYYAALAHVQQLQRESGNREEWRYLEAEARRSLDQTAAAEALYRGLLRGRLAGPAYHGLGLLYAGRDLAVATGYLREAARRAPTDADVRNDLGYALLRAGRYGEALAELATAVELAPESGQARSNLLLLLLVQNDEAAAARIAQQAAVPPEAMTRLRAQARSLRTNAPPGAEGGGS